MGQKPANAKDIVVAVAQLSPYFGTFASPWCRRALFSMLHHTSKATERDIFYRAEVELKTLWSDPWTDLENASYLENELRWCAACLAIGYHCTGHQLIGLLRCPLHNEPILRGCPHCHFALPRLLAGIKVHHVQVARSCPHCGHEILSLENCASWVKRDSFLKLESGRWGALYRWVRRVNSGHLHVLPHESRGTAAIGGYPPPEVVRAVREHLFPLPDGYLFAPIPTNLRVVAVWLDHRARDAPEVSEVDKLAVYEELMQYFGQQVKPEGWQPALLSVDEGEELVADRREFAFFRHDHGYDRARISQAAGEVVRPATFKLWAHRFIRDFDAWRRQTRFYWASTFYWTMEGKPHDRPPPGTATGCLLEAYFFGPGSTPKGGRASDEAGGMSLRATKKRPLINGAKRERRK